MPKVIRKKRTFDPSKQYWLPEMDKHIAHFNTLNTQAERDEYYGLHLRTSIYKLCEFLINTFRFKLTGLEPLKLIDDLNTYLYTKMPNYKIGTESKPKPSFSYFSIVGKNYCIQLAKKGALNQQRNISVHTPTCDDDMEHNHFLQKVFSHDPTEEIPAYMDTAFLQEITNWWNKHQLDNKADSQSLVFRRSYNPILRAILRIIAAPKDYELANGRFTLGLNDILRTDPEVINFGKEFRTRQTSINRIVHRIRVIHALALKHYINYHNLDSFVINLGAVLRILNQGGEYNKPLKTMTNIERKVMLHQRGRRSRMRNNMSKVVV